MAKVLEMARKLSDAGYTSVDIREAMPYIQAFQDKVMVVKIGGSVLNDAGADRQAFLRDVTFMARIGIRVIMVHGGSRHMNDRMKERKLEARVHNGERYTDSETLSLAVEVFNELNRELVAHINAVGGNAVGFPAGASAVVFAERKGNDLANHVGRPTGVDLERLRSLRPEYIPVIPCIGRRGSDLFNINADEVAGKIAETCKAEKLILLTDVDGVRDAKGQLISTLTFSETKRLIEENVIAGGMIPKVSVCLSALDAGVRKAHIINGSTAGSLLCEVLSDSGVGTEIVRNGQMAVAAGA